MTEWLNLTDEERRDSVTVVAAEQGLPVNAVEKDWWVTLVLRALFSTSYAPSLLFKGGTSLSKGWNLIERFSEDIDLALNRETVHTKYGGKLSNRELQKLREDSEEFTRVNLRDALHTSLSAMNLHANRFEITQDNADQSDPHLMVNYQSLYEPSPYLPPRVKIEISTRSLMEPWSNRAIRSFIGAFFEGNNFADTQVQIPTVEPRRTFLEKAFLLHEEFLKEASQVRVTRMSRHLYDLEKLMDSDHGTQALADVDLYYEIVGHRSVFYKRNYVNYDTLGPSTINFIPPDHALRAFEDDYIEMSENMFYGEFLPFEELIIRLAELRQRFRNIVSRHLSLNYWQQFSTYFNPISTHSQQLCSQNSAVHVFVNMAKK
jgi:nucleotidyltransferase AbiEii toxin of type IV toxin-antitoxin system